VTRPWPEGDPQRGERYAERFATLEAAGVNVHGEADFVSALGPPSVLDAGCGTGRVAVELRRRGIEVWGLDRDPAMLAVAREQAPQAQWVEADLADPSLDLGRRFAAVVAAGNVMIFVDPGSEGVVIANLARHLEPGGVLIAGFQLKATGLGPATYDRLAADAGLELDGRFATWDRDPFVAGGDYAVSVHRAR
jgi:SAM-dependent methyltransferase